MPGDDGDGKKVKFPDHVDEVVDDGSDEDSKAVEVTFDPTNPYRRKSSLVSSDLKAPLAKIAASRRSECIVHEMFEAQRGLQAASRDGDEKRYRTHPIYETHDTNSSNSISLHANSGEKKTRRESRAILDETSITDEGGQSDQKRWTREMTKTESEVNLPRYGSQFFQQPLQPQQVDGKNDEVHSRMLTKRQLSDMAWGVRELSRRLSSMRIKFRVKTILILTKIYDLDLIPKTRELTRWLLDGGREVKYNVYVQDKLRDSKRFDANGLLDELAEANAAKGSSSNEAARKDVAGRLKYWDEDMCRMRPQTFDFVITLGGDGTVLYASWLFQRIVPPVLSFALGSLGFLTKFDFDEHEATLASAFEKGVTVSLRLRFESTVMRSIRRKLPPGKEGQLSSDEDEAELHRKRDLVEELIGEEKEDHHTHRPESTFEILNEVVVDRGPNPSMFWFPIVLTIKHTNLRQPCPILKSLATTSTLHLSWQTASAFRHLPDRPRTTSQQVAACATPRTL